MMRTTMTLDPDVAKALQDRMRRLGLTFRQVVNDALRAGVGGGPTGPRQPPFKVRPRAAGFRPGLDPTRLNQLVDELALEDSVAAAAKPRR